MVFGHQVQMTHLHHQAPQRQKNPLSLRRKSVCLHSAYVDTPHQFIAPLFALFSTRCFFLFVLVDFAFLPLLF